MRKIATKERLAAGNIYCSFCRPDKVHALYRKAHPSHRDGYACETHKELITETPERELTEADYQTWVKL